MSKPTKQSDVYNGMEYRVHDKVLIRNDGDGADKTVGTIKSIYRSGRCMVLLPQGGFRNLHPRCLEVIRDPLPRNSDRR